MERLIYISRCLLRPDSQEFADIARVALMRNSRCGVTGYLYHDEDVFLQVLEGMAEDVGAIYAAIQADWRHRDVRTLSVERAERRHFGGWAMGVHDGTAAGGGLLSLHFGPDMHARARASDVPELTRFLRDLALGRPDVYSLTPA